MDQCEPFGLSAPHVSCHVSLPLGAIWYPHDHAMCHPTPDALKNVKFRLSRNPLKFDKLSRFCEVNSKMKSVSSSEI